MANRNSSQKKKILIVDDEVNFLKIIKLNLEAKGYAVVTALEGEEALRKLKSENPDVVILDIMLPKLNGDEVCRCIRSDPVFNKTPVIMLTGKDADVDRIVARVIGADIYITKPSDLEQLNNAIKKVL
ncbi:MAG: response regulator [Candidatus Omnitrophica bacterium]|jgi:DNA-binding response OmpR family regulator|nr:response regulator [Candidatus Omnitrophota bacterium]MDD5253179.1 response regulator [Candidatus Omnitrophota bacterium]